VDETITRAPPPPYVSSAVPTVINCNTLFRYPVDTLGKFFTPVALAAAAVDAVSDGPVQALWIKSVYFCSGPDVPAAASAAHLVSVFAKFRAQALAK
jgi:hypothetical protein